MNFDRFKETIKRHEGSGPVEGGRYMPYKDTVDLTTIGYGRCLDRVGISASEADVLLHNDLIDAIQAVSKAIPVYDSLSDARQEVLANMCFNLGIRGLLQFTNMLAAIDRGEFIEASKHLLSSKYAGQVGKRAMDLAQMLRDG